MSDSSGNSSSESELPIVSAIALNSDNVELKPSTENSICPDMLETQLSGTETLLELHNSLLLTTAHKVITHADKACQANEFHMKCQKNRH
ncbi:hypothetical protein FQA39_LY09601 [Lamprigera yunnana]|nr:hypothetical protein FQA39_LY09601 [Lamprigera yunnana]